MKARHIRKLRKRISSFDVYLIRESVGIFGDFDGISNMGLKMDNYYVTADGPELALKRFFSKYERMFNCKHDKYTARFETTMEWGRMMVKNQRTKITKFYQ